MSASAQAFLARLRVVLYEIALGMGESLDEVTEKRRFLDGVAERLMPLACVWAQPDGSGAWQFASRPRAHDWSRHWPKLMRAGGAPHAEASVASWTVACATDRARGATAHLWSIGEFGVFALLVPTAYPPPALDEITRALARFRAALQACREHAHLRELLHAQRISARVFELSPLAIVFCDESTRIVDVNPAFERITGWRRDEALGQTPRMLASGRHDRAFYAAMWQAIGTHGHWQGEIWNRRKDGSQYPQILTVVAIPDRTGAVRSYVGIFQDIGEQKAREAQLRDLRDRLQRNNDYLQAILDHLGEGVYALDGQGRCTFFNASAERLLGWRAHEVIGRDLHELIHHHRADGEPLPASRCPIRLAFVHRRSYRSDDETFWHKEGHAVPVRVAGAPLYRDGELVASVAVFDDVSAERELARRLRQAKEAAEAAARMKSDFLAVMSHEIRTPLNGVIGMSDLLADTALDAEQAEFVRTIKASANHLLALIDNILDYSKLDAGAVSLERQPVDLAMLLDAGVELVAPRLADKPVLLASRLAPGVPAVVEADPTRLRQILLNLLGNAAKFTEAGLIEAAIEPGARPGWLRLAVRDTGCGIAPEAIPRLFSPFTQADAATTRKYGGTGLGLAIVRKLAEAMGGSAGVQSAPGAGSLFHVDLPLPEGASPRRAPAGEVTVALIGEDEAAVGLWQRLLDGAGVGVKRCRDVEELAQALQGEAAVTVAVAARDAPWREAVALAQRRAQRPWIVALDAARARQQRAVWEGSGAAAVLASPFTQGRVRERIAQVLGGAPVDARAATGAPANSGADGLAVLLAEDNAVNQRVAVALLQKLGHAVTLASDGREAVAAWRAGAFDVVLMDCRMPGMDGFAATAEIRRLETETGRARTHIVALTANALQGDRERCLAAGMDDYVAKPVTRERLAAAFARMPRARAGQARDAAPFDPQLLQAAAGDDPELAREIVGIFLGELPTLIGRLHAAARDADAALLRAAAHELKGSARTVGARRLSALAERLEAQAADGRIAGELLARLEAERGEFERAAAASRG